MNAQRKIKNKISAFPKYLPVCFSHTVRSFTMTACIGSVYFCSMSAYNCWKKKNHPN